LSVLCLTKDGANHWLKNDKSHFSQEKASINYVHLLSVKFVVLITLITALSACSDLKKQDQLDRLEKIQERVEKAKSQLTDNVLKEAGALKTVEDRVMSSIQELEDDTIELEVAYRLDEIKHLYLKLTPTLAQYDELNTFLDEEDKILKKLKVDIENGNGKRHKYDKFISYEEKKVTKLEEAVNNYMENKTAISEFIDEVEDDLNSLGAAEPTIYF
jgi:chromosome segregation ATPase